jgi:hypothetical protein
MEVFVLSLIEVGENEVSRYKQETFIAPGKYYMFQGMKPSDVQKKRLQLMACSNRTGRFMWLAPYEPWVKRMLDGSLIQVPAKLETVDWSLIGIRQELVRRWQQWLLNECYTYLRAGLEYRRGWVAPLGAGKTLAGLLIGQFFEPGEVAVLASRYLHETWKSQAAEWGFPIPLLSTPDSCHKLPNSVKCLLVDEIADLANPDTAKAIKATKVSEKCEVAVGFTAKPLRGRGPLDWRWLRILAPGSVPSDPKAFQFAWGLDTELKEVGPNKAYITTEWDKQKLAKFIAPFVHTIDISEISDELPEVTVSYIHCPKPKQYDQIKAGAGTTNGTHKRLAQVLQCTDGFIYNDADQPVRLPSEKLKAVVEWVEGLDEPVLLVAAWTDTINQLADLFIDLRPAVLSGGVTNPGAEIERFKTGQTRLMIANAGYSKGMNLQKICRTAGFVSIGSRPDDLVQMKGRLARPGQRDAVQFVFFVCDDTMDMRRIELVTKHNDCTEQFIEKLLLEELTK